MTLLALALHFRRSSSEGKQGFEECPEFAIVWACEAERREIVFAAFPGKSQRRRSACEGRRSGLSQGRARRSVSSDLGTSQQQSSTNVYIHWFKCQQPMFDHTLRTCCCPAPQTSFTSWKCSSIAQRAATASKISRTSADVSVQKYGAQLPSSKRTITTRIWPLTNSEVARNVLY